MKWRTKLKLLAQMEEDRHMTIDASNHNAYYTRNVDEDGCSFTYGHLGSEDTVYFSVFRKSSVDSEADDEWVDERNARNIGEARELIVLLRQFIEDAEHVLG